MGMHEFEDVVEASIRLLAQEEQGWELDLRSMFHELYQFQARFDTGFTNLRVLDILLKARYSYRFPVSQHPDYMEHREFFDALDEFEFIAVDPTAPWNPLNNPIAGFHYSGQLYCDVGSPLWERFVDLGVLTGDDAAPPAPMELAQVVAQIVRLAEERGDKELIRMWYPLFILGLDDWDAPDVLERLKSDPSVQQIRMVVQRSNALAIEMRYGNLELPYPGDLEDNPLLAWWYEVNGGTREEPRAGKLRKLSKIYSTDGEFIYRYGEKRPEIDAGSFRIIGRVDCILGLDKRAVYSSNGIIEGADPLTFDRLDECFFRDENSIYYAHHRLDQLDPHATRVFNRMYVGDENWLYYCDFHGVKPPFLVEPQPRMDTLKVRGEWAFDQNQMYFAGEPVPGVDCRSVSFFDEYGFYKDVRGVYYQRSRLEGADPETFEAIGSGYGKDEEAVYFMATRIWSADPATFEVQKDWWGWGGDAKGVYHFGKLYEPEH